jgi:hypothetical protein
MTHTSPSSNDWLGTLGLFVTALLSVVFFHTTGNWYQNYWIAAAGLYHIHLSELAFYAWYSMFGMVTILSLTALLVRLQFSDKLFAVFQKLWERPQLLLGLVMGFVLVDILLFQAVVMMYEPVCDDELTYRFIAQTLLQGGVTNPLPAEPAFFKNVFVLTTTTGWYGKYPIGHPLMLAVGEVVGLRFLVPPLLSLGSLWLTVQLGHLLFEDKRIGLLGAVLLGVSPYFVLTGGTELSQVSSTFFVLLGLWSLLKLEQSKHLGWGLLSGLVWGFVVFVRPMPGVLFLPVVALYVLLGFQGVTGKERIRALLAGLAPLVVMGVLFLLVNRFQTGSPLKTGYQQVHGNHYLDLSAHLSNIASSVSSALLRQNFWLLGVPFSLLFVLFVRHRRPLWLVWGVFAAEYGYRILYPKTVVATTGPVYVAEMTPLLALLTACGLFALKEWLERWKYPTPLKLLQSLVLAMVVTSMCLFVPVQLRSLHAGALKRQTLMKLLEPRLYQDALVFVNKMVQADALATWAYTPPNPHPKLKERVIFVRLQFGLDGAKRSIAFWKKRFPKRAAWVFYYYKGKPVLKSVSTARDFMPAEYWKRLQQQKAQKQKKRAKPAAPSTPRKAKPAPTTRPRNK